MPISPIFFQLLASLSDTLSRSRSGEWMPYLGNAKLTSQSKLSGDCLVLLLLPFLRKKGLDIAINWQDCVNKVQDSFLSSTVQIL